MSEALPPGNEQANLTAGPRCTEPELQRYARFMLRELSHEQGCICCLAGLYTRYHIPLALHKEYGPTASVRRGGFQPRDLGFLVYQLGIIILVQAVGIQIALRQGSFEITPVLMGWVIGFDLLVCILVSLPSALEIVALRRLLARCLDAEEIVYRLCSGEDLAGRIIRKVPQPFRLLFMCYRLNPRSRAVAGLADNLDWYLRPNTVHIRWIWLGYLLMSIIIVVLLGLLFTAHHYDEHLRNQLADLPVAGVAVLWQLSYISAYRRVVCREYLMLYIHDHYFADAADTPPKPLQ